MKRRIIKCMSVMVAVVLVITSVNWPQRKMQVRAASSATIPEGYTAIYTIDDLYAIRNNPSGNYILMSDIDMTTATAPGGEYDVNGNGWVPIPELRGTLEGNGYRIIGMQQYGDLDGTSCGLIKNLYGGTIKNLGMVDANINVENVGHDNGILVSHNGRDYSYTDYIGYINNSFVSGSLTISSAKGSRLDVGGLVGYAVDEVKITNCYTEIKISLPDVSEVYVGGILGYDGCYSPFTRCYSASTIEGGTGYYIKLLCGRGGSFTNCIAIKDTRGLTQNYSGDVTLINQAMALKSTSYTGFDFTDTWEIDPYASYKYPQLKSCRQNKVAGLEVVTKPAKLTYAQGEKLDLANGTVKLTYENGFTTTVVMTESMISGYDAEHIGEQTLSVSYGGASGSFDVKVNGISVTGVKINAPSTKVEKGNSIQLSADITPSDASDKTITWTSSDASGASVDNTGRVSGLNTGTYKITATAANGISDNIDIQVTSTCVSMTLSKTSVEIYKGNSEKITANLSPLDSTDKVTWKSANEKIANVVDGTIIGVGAGRTTVTATAESGISAKCNVVVKQGMENVTVTGVENKEYTGLEIKQNIVVKDGDFILTEGVDYTITYNNNVEAGTASVTIVGMGLYEGNVVENFTITKVVETPKPTQTPQITATPEVIVPTPVIIETPPVVLPTPTATNNVAHTVHPIETTVAAKPTNQPVATNTPNPIIPPTAKPPVFTAPAQATPIPATPEPEEDYGFDVCIVADDSSSVSLKNVRAGDTYDLYAEVYDLGYEEDNNEVEEPEINWSSKNKNIAIVDENGTVTFLSAGEVEIVATYKNNGKSYTDSIKIKVGAARSSNKYLSKISVSKGKLSPAFKKTKTAYTLTLSKDVSKVKITPKKSDSKATIIINGKRVNSVTVSVSKGKKKTVTIKVIAENKSTKTYKIVVSRKRK